MSRDIAMTSKGEFTDLPSAPAVDVALMRVHGKVSP